MKVWAILLAISLITAEAQADSDFSARIKAIQEGNARLQERVEKLGAMTARTNGFGFSRSAPAGVEEQKPKPLFQVLGELNPILLAKGRLLYGRTLNRLVVSSDGAPALVELEAGQGLASGLRVMGSAASGSGGDRLVISFHDLLFPGGRDIQLQATALDTQGAYGLAAQVVSQKTLSVLGALGSSFVSGLAASQQDVTTNSFGFQNVQPGGRNSLLQGLAQTAADQSKRLIDEATAEKPVLIVEPLTPVTILIQQEVRE